MISADHQRCSQSARCRDNADVCRSCWRWLLLLGSGRVGCQGFATGTVCPCAAQHLGVGVQIGFRGCSDGGGVEGEQMLLLLLIMVRMLAMMMVMMRVSHFPVRLCCTSTAQWRSTNLALDRNRLKNTALHICISRAARDNRLYPENGLPLNIKSAHALGRPMGPRLPLSATRTNDFSPSTTKRLIYLVI